MKNLKIFSILRLFLFLVLVNGLCISTFAEPTKTCIVDIPIVVIDKSENISKNATVEIELTSSNGTTKIFILKHSDKSTKISLEFNMTGNYHYTIKQKSCSDSNVKLDATIYTINILIDDNSKELISAMSIAKNEKTDIVKFENVLLDDEPPITTTEDDYEPPITTSTTDDDTPVTDNNSSTPTTEDNTPDTEDTNSTSNTEPDVDYGPNTVDKNPETGLGISSGLLVANGTLVLIAAIIKKRKG